MYGMHVRFTTKPGQADAFAQLLLDSGGSMPEGSGCLIYLISRDPEDVDVVYVTEAWTSKAAHGASLEDPATRAVIDRAMPLLEGPPQATVLAPVGGVGLGQTGT